jgi:hypothetical protein
MAKIHKQEISSLIDSSKNPIAFVSKDFLGHGFVTRKKLIIDSIWLAFLLGLLTFPLVRESSAWWIILAIFAWGFFTTLLFTFAKPRYFILYEEGIETKFDPNTSAEFHQWNEITQLEATQINTFGVSSRSTRRLVVSGWKEILTLYFDNKQYSYYFFYPKEIPLHDRIDNSDISSFSLEHNAMNIAYIIYRRAYNARKTGEIRFDDLLK